MMNFQSCLLRFSKRTLSSIDMTISIGDMDAKITLKCRPNQAEQCFVGLLVAQIS